MKRAIFSLAILVMAAGVAFAGVSKDDIQKLVSAGVGDDVILSFVKANGPVASLSADDLIALKNAGASEKLLQAILAVKTVEQTPAPTPSYEQPKQSYEQSSQRVVERETVYVPTYTYYPSYYYYYPSYYPSYCYYPSYYYPRYYSYPSFSFFYARSRFSHHRGSSFGFRVGY